MQGVIGIVERGVPECHDRIADIFVDRAAFGEHDPGQWVEQPVHQRGQPFRLVLQRLGNGGEAAHVAEQDRQGLALAAEVQLRRVRGEPLHQDRRQILRERAHDAAPQPPLRRVVASALCGRHCDEGDRRRDRRHVEPAEMQQQEARRNGGGDSESRECSRQPSGPAPDRGGSEQGGCKRAGRQQPRGGGGEMSCLVRFS